MEHYNNPYICDIKRYLYAEGFNHEMANEPERHLVNHKERKAYLKGRKHAKQQKALNRSKPVVA